MVNVRAGIIGIGVMGRHHARILSNLEGVDFVGAVDPVGAGLKPPAGLNIYTNPEELLKQGIDYCVVASPTMTHEAVGMILSSAGVHALIEKPLAADSRSARRLSEEFAKAGLVAGVGHVERYNPALQQARTRIESGEIGQIFQVSTRRQGPFPDRISDVGVVKDLGTHDFDLTTWITQQPYASLMARMAHRAGRPHEDLIAVVGSLADGTVVNHLVNWLTPFKERQTVVTGSEGAFVIDTLTADLTYFANSVIPATWEDVARFRGVAEGDMVRFAFPKSEPLRSEHEAFRDAVLGKSNNIVTLQEGVTNILVAEAIIKSAETGHTVNIEVADS